MPHPEAVPPDPQARWNAITADYERWAEPLTAPYAHAAVSLAGGVAPGEPVLDVAAGTGALSLAAAAAGAHVLAIDLSPGMVARLRERLQPFPGCEARLMDGQVLDLADASFSASFSVFGVSGFPDWRRGLGEQVRVTRPGGRVVVVTWTDPQGAGPTIPLLRAHRSAFPDAALPALPPGLGLLASAATLQTELRAAGCDEVEMHVVDHAWTRPSLIQAFADLEWILRLSPVYSALDPDGRARLDPPLRAAMAAYAGPDGVVRIPASAHVAIGHKPG